MIGISEKEDVLNKIIRLYHKSNDKNYKGLIRGLKSKLGIKEREAQALLKSLKPLGIFNNNYGALILKEDVETETLNLDEWEISSRLLSKIEPKIILKTSNLIDVLIKETNKKIVKEVGTRKTIIAFKCGSLVKNSEPTSFNLLLSEDSGVGKDYVLKKTLEIFPEDNHFHKSKITPQVLAYWHNSLNENENWSWKGKSLHLEEISYSTLNSETLTGFLSNKNYSGVVLIKQKTLELEINGKPSIFITTASKNPKKDMLRRLAMCQLNDSVNQTKEIVKRQSECAKKGKSLDYNKEITEALKHLKKVKVRIPFADKLGIALLNKVSKAHKILRTNYPRYLDIIKSFTALYQYQRERDDNGYLLATYEDYKNALPVLNKITTTGSTIPLTKEKKEILKIINNLGDDFHDVSEINGKVTFCSKQTLYKRLKELANDDFLVQDKVTKEDTKGRDYKAMGYKPADIDSFEFPKVKEVKNLENVETVDSVETVENVDEASEPTDSTVSTYSKPKPV